MSAGLLGFLVCFFDHCPCDELPGFDATLVKDAVIHDIDFPNVLTDPLASGFFKYIQKLVLLCLIKCFVKTLEIAEVLFFDVHMVPSSIVYLFSRMAGCKGTIVIC